jgi:hypothetical protein
MTLLLQLNVYSNPLKLCDMLYILKAIFIRKFENSVILLKKKIHKIKSKIFPHCYMDTCISTRRLLQAASNENAS